MFGAAVRFTLLATLLVTLAVTYSCSDTVVHIW